MRYLPLLFLCAACVSPADMAPEEGMLTVRLEPYVYSDSTRLMWSPKGEKLYLSDHEKGLETRLYLGSPETPPWGLLLAKAAGEAHYTHLYIDRDHNGQYDETERLTTTANESRNKFWSSFETVIDIPVIDPWTETEVSHPYGLSFWYVEDPAADEQEAVLRFSRRHWMQGAVNLEGVAGYILVAEDSMDGVFGPEDDWKLVVADSLDLLYHYKEVRPLRRHAWLGEKAYQLAFIDPSGRKMTLAPYDPGITRAEERIQDDKLRVDRQAARSGQQVAFGHDFAEAEAAARAANQPLFIDFETTWCGPCKTMDQWVYTADDVVAATADMVAVKVDGDEHPDIVERFGVTAYPTMVLLLPDGTVANKTVGYRSVAEMTAFLTN